MIREALSKMLEHAEQLATAKSQPKPFSIGNIDDRVFLASAVDGKITEYAMPSPRRSHQVRTVNDMVSAIQKLANLTPAGDGEVTSPCRVWVGENEIVAVLDDNIRRDFIRQPLAKTETFAALVRISGKPMNQAEMIRVLRTTFDGSTSAELLLATVRQVRFTKTESGHGDLKTGKESLGRSVEAEVTGAKEFPEDISIRLQVFRDRSLDSKFEVELTMNLTVNVDDQKFTLELLPDSATNAIDEALSAIADWMEDQMAGVDVLCGSFKA